jgi:hypothetical protein
MTADTYRIENAAEERGSNRQMLLNIAGDMGDMRATMLRIDTAVRRWSPVSVAALVIAVVALVIAIVALILVVQLAALRAAVLPFSSPPHQLVPTAQAIALSIAWRGPFPGVWIGTVHE